jgi:hypothetical protein
MRLGEILVQHGAVTTQQLDEALRTQSDQGGRIGTNLVALDYLDLDTLTDALSFQCGAPPAHVEHLEAVRAGALALVPAGVAAEHTALPLGQPLGADRVVVVALRSPTDRAVLAELERITGRQVMPAVAPELRLYAYLERYYGVPRHALRGRDPGGAVAWSPLAARIQRAASPDEIGDALCEGLRMVGEHGLVFRVKDRVAIAWKGFAPAGVQGLGTLSIPLTLPSMLRRGAEGKTLFCGEPIAEGGIYHHRIWTALGARPPREVVVVPVVLGKQVPNLLYAHPREGQSVPESTLTALAALAMAAATTYARLVGSRRAH